MALKVKLKSRNKQTKKPSRAGLIRQHANAFRIFDYITQNPEKQINL